MHIDSGDGLDDCVFGIEVTGGILNCDSVLIQMHVYNSGSGGMLSGGFVWLDGVRYQFIPQVLFLNALFGYLSFLILLKWVQGSKPDLYHVMIYMFLSPLDDLGENQLFAGQTYVQVRTRCWGRVVGRVCKALIISAECWISERGWCGQSASGVGLMEVSGGVIAGCAAFGSVGCCALDAVSKAADFAKAACSGASWFRPFV